MTNNTTSEQAIFYIGFTERVIVASLFLIIFFIGTVGNLMVIIAVALSKTLRTRTNVFVVNLSFGDLVACLVMPWWSVALLSDDEWLIPGTEWICTASGLVTFMSIGISLWSITYIAVNRFILITRPFQTYQKVYTTRNMLLMLLFSYVLTITLVGLPTYIGFGRIAFVPESHTCSDIIATSTAESYDRYQGVLPALLLSTIVVCYIAIYLHVRRHFKQRQRATRGELSMNSTADVVESSVTSSGVTNDNVMIHQQDQKRKINRDMIDITKNLFMCVCILIICLIPISAVNIVNSPPQRRVYGLVVAFANSAINPLIYAWRHPHFKVVLRLMFRCRYTDIPQPSNFLQRFLSTDTCK